jgi:hypothetical protein
LVKVGRFVETVSIGGEIPAPKVIGQDQDHVRAVLSNRGGGEEQADGQGDSDYTKAM